MKNLQDLIDLISLEEIDTGLFKGQSFQTPWKRVFGGQVLAQALNAVYRTVPEDRLCHSLHGYFILPGDVDRPIIYKVDTLRDGGSFSTRRVTASQNNKAIFIMAASFHKEKDGLNHQNSMPEVLDPSELLTDINQAEMFKDKAPDMYQKVKNKEQHAIEFRPVENILLGEELPESIYRNVWMKGSGHVELTLPMQHQLLAFASDYDLLLSAVYRHRADIDVNKLFLASLDHAMWFHRGFDFNNWLLYVINSPSASNSRGMGYGNIFDESGRLVATVMQEGLIGTRR